MPPKAPPKSATPSTSSARRSSIGIQSPTIGQKQSEQRERYRTETSISMKEYTNRDKTSTILDKEPVVRKRIDFLTG